MNSKLVSTKQHIETVRHNAQRTADFFISDNACGTMIPSGAYIGALLQLEGDKESQMMVLSDVMQTLAITPNDISKYRREECIV